MNGLRVAQAGTDVDKAADYELVLDSSWPTLGIVKQGPIPSYEASSGFGSVVAEHNLSHYAPFLIFSYAGTGDSYNAVDPTSLTFDNSTSFSLSKNKLLFTSSSAYSGGYYYIFDYDLDKEFLADNKGISPNPASNTKTGVKILNQSKPSKMDSNDTRNHYLNTQARSLAVHLVKKVQPVSNNITITHNLGYLPSYLFYREATATVVLPARINLVLNITTATNTVLNLRGAQAVLSGDYYCVVLKEPFLLQ